MIETTTTEEAILQNQVHRILSSEEFRGSEVLRHLLAFLAKKSACGESEDLKEYTIAVEGLGRPSSYDPRHNSTVRIQVSRLRQKLDDYYGAEGAKDPIRIDVPKGHFKLTCEVRPTALTEDLADRSQVGVAATDTMNGTFHKPKLEAASALPLQWKWSRILPWIACIAALCLAMFFWLKTIRLRPESATGAVPWNEALEDLWGPFVSSKRPLIVAIDDPLFVVLQRGSGIYYRDRSIDSWDDVSNSEMLLALRSALHNPDIKPSQYYTSFGAASVSFLLGKVLGTRQQHFDLAKTTDLSWQQLSDNNVLFVGRLTLVDEKIHSASIKATLVPTHDGIQDLNPAPGQPKFYADGDFTRGDNRGTVYAVVTHLPGPLGNSHVESFTSVHSAGYVAAVKAFTDPDFASTLVSKLKAVGSGKMPKYYQVLLKVSFEDDVPVSTTCVTVRELQ